MDNNNSIGNEAELLNLVTEYNNVSYNGVGGGGGWCSERYYSGNVGEFNKD